MSDKLSFLDTNIIAYSFDPIDKTKQQVASNLVKTGYVEGNMKISFQVVQEFLNLSTRKFSTTILRKDAKDYLREILLPMCAIYPSGLLWEHALSIHYRWQFSFYDSMIISAAIQAKCEVLYSEDLQHEQQIETLEIINPFL